MSREHGKFLPHSKLVWKLHPKRNAEKLVRPTDRFLGKMTKNDGLSNQQRLFFFFARTHLLSPLLVLLLAMGTLIPPDVPAFWVAVDVSPGVAQSGSPYGGAMVAVLAAARFVSFVCVPKPPQTN
jgi:hypothetical protein